MHIPIKWGVIVNEYVVRIKWDDIAKGKTSTAVAETRTQQQIASKPVEREVKNTSNDTLAVLRRVATVYALGTQAVGFGVNYMAQQAMISGNTLKAERMNTSFNNAKKVATTGLGIGLSVATGNPLIIAMTAYGLAQQAINLGLETQRYTAQLSVERQRSAYYTDRVVRNISEVR